MCSPEPPGWMRTLQILNSYGSMGNPWFQIASSIERIERNSREVRLGNDKQYAPQLVEGMVGNTRFVPLLTIALYWLHRVLDFSVLFGYSSEHLRDIILDYLHPRRFQRPPSPGQQITRKYLRRHPRGAAWLIVAGSTRVACGRDARGRDAHKACPMVLMRFPTIPLGFPPSRQALEVEVGSKRAEAGLDSASSSIVQETSRPETVNTQACRCSSRHLWETSLSTLK